jgi:hypothetical protein
MPYLEKNVESRIFLIQTFFSDSPGLNSNRGKIGEWTANKFKSLFGKRFDYHKLVIYQTKTGLRIFKPHRNIEHIEKLTRFSHNAMCH